MLFRCTLGVLQFAFEHGRERPQAQHLQVAVEDMVHQPVHARVQDRGLVPPALHIVRFGQERAQLLDLVQRHSEILSDYGRVVLQEPPVAHQRRAQLQLVRDLREGRL